MTLIINTSIPTTEQVAEKSEQEKTKTASPIFSLSLLSHATEGGSAKLITQAANKALDVWTEVMISRTQTSQQTLNAESIELTNDLAIASNYQELIKSFKGHLQGIQKDKKRVIMLLSDESQRIQSLCSLQEKMDKIEVDVLLSAPWNVTMNSQNSAEHKQIAVKGAGTCMMRQIYELAQQKRKKTVELRPIDSARAFYEQVLKMKVASNEKILYFDVDQDKVPEKLKSSSSLFKSQQSE